MNGETPWREVTVDEFFAAMTGDVHPHIAPGPWPYTSLFRTRDRTVKGKLEGYYPEGSALAANRYWLPG